jgi:hypothetical protein
MIKLLVFEGGVVMIMKAFRTMPLPNVKSSTNLLLLSGLMMSICTVGRTMIVVWWW